MDAQLKKGVLDICILSLLSREEKYGYEIIKEIQPYFEDTDESVFYAVIRRLNKSGLTDIRYSEESNGPVRKYYSLTDLGKETLRKYKSSWKYIEAIFKQLNVF